MKLSTLAIGIVVMGLNSTQAFAGGLPSCQTLNVQEVRQDYIYDNQGQNPLHLLISKITRKCEHEQTSKSGFILLDPAQSNSTWAQKAWSRAILTAFDSNGVKIYQSENFLFQFLYKGLMSPILPDSTNFIIFEIEGHQPTNIQINP